MLQEMNETVNKINSSYSCNRFVNKIFKDKVGVKRKRSVNFHRLQNCSQAIFSFEMFRLFQLIITGARGSVQIIPLKKAEFSLWRLKH